MSSAKVAEALESARIGEVNEWQGVCQHCYSARRSGISTAVIFLLHTQFDKDSGVCGHDRCTGIFNLCIENS